MRLGLRLSHQIVCAIAVGGVLPLFLFSCGTGEVPSITPTIELGQVSDPIMMNPFPPLAQGEYSVTYHPSHPNALFSIRDSLHALVTISTMQGIQTFDYPMKRQDGMFTATCSLPADAYAVNVTILTIPHRTHQESRTFPVFNQEGPALGAIPTIMESSPNTVELFNLDRGVYPSYLWRYYPYWKKQIEHRRDPTVIIPQLDSIYELFRNKIGSLDAVSTLAVCLFGNVAAGRHMVAYNIASLLSEVLKRERRNIPAPFLSSILGESIAILRLRSTLHKNDTLFLLASALNRLLVKLLPASAPSLIATWVKPSVQKTNRHQQVSVRILCEDEQSDSPWNKLDESTAIELVRWYAHEPDPYAVASVGTKIIPAISSVAHLTDTIRAYAIAALHRFLSIAEGRDKRAVSCKTPAVQFAGEGIFSAAELQLGTLLLQQNAENGKAVLQKLIARYKRTYMTVGPISLACITLARYWLGQKNLDSALHYWAIASMLGSPFAEKLWDTLRLAGIKTSIHSALAKVRLPPHLAELHYEILPISTENGLYDPYQSDHPTMLLFSSHHCGLCRKFYPLLIEKVTRERLPCSIIVVRAEPGYRLFLPPRVEAAITYANADPSLLRSYGVEGFPTVIIIHAGKVIYHGGLSSDAAISHLVETLRKAMQQTDKRLDVSQPLRRR